MPLIWTGFVMGLAGGMHCILMCGPLAASLHITGQGRRAVWFRNFQYQGGRITSYLLIGLLFGVLGQIISLFFYQQLLSVISGAALLLWALLYFFQGVSGSGSRALKLWSGAASGLFKKLRKQNSPLSVFGIGMLNGFLPCGMVYLAAMASVNNGNIGYSLLYMLVFGIGTLPAMTSIIVTRNFLPVKWRFSLRKISPVFLTLLGFLFIMRGLDLNIPYLSPHINQASKGASIQNCGAKPTAGIKINQLK